MPGSKALSSLFRSAIKTATSTSAEDATLKNFVSPVDNLCASTSSSSSSFSEIVLKRANVSWSSMSGSWNCSPKLKSSVRASSLKMGRASPSDVSTEMLSKEISSILHVGTDSETTDEKSIDKVLDIPWFSSMSNNNVPLRRRELLRERKQKWIFKSTQVNRFERLVKMCAKKLGTDATIQVFGKLGRETGVKEYTALIGLCIEEARKAEDDELSFQKTSKAFQLLKSMREQGFQIKEETYSPILRYLIDMGMIEEFNVVLGFIKDSNPTSFSRLGYYQMRLWIEVNNEEKIQELCKNIADPGGGDKCIFEESYLLALCDSDRKKELLLLLEMIDITKVSSVDLITSIFKSLGRLSLDSFADKFLLAFKSSDHAAENISHFIFNYVVSMPNLAVDDIILRFKDLHARVEMVPSSAPYENLVAYCCDSHKVHEALDFVDQMCDVGLTLSLGTFHSILRASEEGYEFISVRRLYSMISCHNLMPNDETFRSMITLSMKMKDFDSAYNMLENLKEANLIPTATMYNAIILGYFREKNIYAALKIYKQMELADVKPDSHTFSFLICNCDSEEDISKYYEKMNLAGVQVTKHIFMALINAYAACGQFEKAKQVVLDKQVPVKSINEIKSVLVAALASHGHMADALEIYSEVTQAGCTVEPKAIISLLEHNQSEIEVPRLLQLLEELTDRNYWLDGCCRVILYCVQHKHLSYVTDLIKQIRVRFSDDDLAVEAACDEAFSLIAEMEPADLQSGLELLRIVKEEVGLCPSRKSLDFLLGACVSAKDLRSSRLIWKEYHAAGLPYNVVGFLRMYQALLASGDLKSAAKMMYKIPKDDPHIREIIRACQVTRNWGKIKK